MVGDYYRYLAETQESDLFEEVSQKALQYYQAAQQIKLSPCNAVKLSLALNFSVFQKEVMNNASQALHLADSALSEAIDEIDELTEEEFNDAKSII